MLHQTYQGIVYPWHCDHMGHMNVMYYAGKFDEATWVFYSSIGLQGKTMRDGKTGMVAVEQNVKYRTQLMPGDTITIHSELVEFSDKSIKIRHEMRNDVTGDVAATAMVKGLYFDREAHKSISFPEGVKVKLQGM